jgi:predicted alpha-1,2-mannosidase
MKKILLGLSFVICHLAFVQAASKLEPVDYVSTLVGTESKFSLSTGNTYPAIAMPWGMNFWVPQTGKMGDGWQYVYSADKIRGFKQTHQPSPWINDYGQFSLMPTVGEKIFDEDKRASWFSHKAETALPYYYRVYLADYDIIAEMAPTARAVMMQFTFPKTDQANIVIDAFDKGSYIKVLPNERKIIGYTTRNSGGVPENFKNYFVILFDKAFSEVVTVKDSIFSDAQEVETNHAGAIVTFKTKKGEKICAQVASSFISFEQAEVIKKNFLSYPQTVYKTMLGLMTKDTENVGEALEEVYGTLI